MNLHQQSEPSEGVLHARQSCNETRQRTLHELHLQQSPDKLCILSIARRGAERTWKHRRLAMHSCRRRFSTSAACCRGSEAAVLRCISMERYAWQASPSSRSSGGSANAFPSGSCAEAQQSVQHFCQRAFCCRCCIQHLALRGPLLHSHTCPAAALTGSLAPQAQ